MEKEAWEDLANGRFAILHVVPPSAGTRAKYAADAVLLVHTYLSQGMNAGRDLTQVGNGNRKGVPVPPSTPFSRNNGGNPGQGKAQGLEALRADMDPELFTLLQAKTRVPPRKETHLLPHTQKTRQGVKRMGCVGRCA